MEFRGIQLDLLKQVRATTYELGMRKFPGLVLIEGRDLNGSRRRKDVDEQVRGKGDKLTRLMTWKPYIFNRRTKLENCHYQIRI
jgi:hypothetical protein